MRRRDRHSLALALAACASLALHAAVIFAALEFGGRVKVVDWRPTPAGAAERADSPAILPTPDVDELGKTDGLGTAVADAAGDRPLRATRQAQDQPLLGSAAPGPLAAGADAEPSAAELLASPPVPTSPPLPPSPTLEQLAEAAALSVASPPPSPPAAPSPPASPRAVDAASDPGPDVDNEVDLFAKEVVAEFRAGEVEAQQGRAFKISGLRQGLSAYLDLAFMARPIVISFRIELDRDGTPLGVTPTRSSGSRPLDEAVRKALFRSWFEPDPRRDGEAVGEPFTFTLRIV